MTKDRFHSSKQIVCKFPNHAQVYRSYLCRVWWIIEKLTVSMIQHGSSFKYCMLWWPAYKLEENIFVWKTPKILRTVKSAQSEGGTLKGHGRKAGLNAWWGSVTDGSLLYNLIRMQVQVRKVSAAGRLFLFCWNNVLWISFSGLLYSWLHPFPPFHSLSSLTTLFFLYCATWP